jgi:hypothetical protein
MMWSGHHTSLGLLGTLPVGPVLCDIVLPALSIQDIIRLSCTCKTMRVICAEDPMWMQICLANVRGAITFQVCFALSFGE